MEMALIEMSFNYPGDVFLYTEGSVEWKLLTCIRNHVVIIVEADPVFHFSASL